MQLRNWRTGLKRLIDRLLGSSQSVSAVQPFVPPGRRIYCIGDIHGQAELLHNLHRQILADRKAFTGDAVLIYLGDYIDRGDQSREVIDILLQPLIGFETIHLLGNHEQTLLDFLSYPREVISWLSFGGRATLQSYGVPHGFMPTLEELDEIRNQLEANLPAAHLQFFKELKVFHVAGSYAFVHAGIRPGIPLQAQRKEDLLWIRDEFMSSQANHELIVVHGHTPTPAVEFRENRIGIDTGAYYSGVLTCLVLEGDQSRLLQTGTDSVS